MMSARVETTRRRRCMSRRLDSTIRSLLFLACTSTSLVPRQHALAQTPNWAPVEEALGRKGALQPGDVIKFSFPRSDLAVTVGGVAVKPALALGTWVAFKTVAPEQAM